VARVAIVEDDKKVCDLLARQLPGAGHKCVTVTEGVCAFEILKQTRPDVILLDLMMSGVSGFRLCRMIRRDRILYRTPIIVLACAEDEQEVAYCKELGADDFLAKPVAAEKVAAKVDDLLVSYETAKERDPATGLPGLEAVRMELNHKLARGEGVAACYLGISNLREVTKGEAVDSGGLSELARGVAGLIHRVAEDLRIYEMLVGYVGAAHFVVALRLDEYEGFCERFVKKFDKEFVWRREGGVARTGSNSKPEISIGVVHNQNRKYRSADSMFKMLSRVLHEAQELPGSSHLVCRCPVGL